MHPNDKINELIEKIRTGEIYGEIQSQLEENLKKRKLKSTYKSSNIEELQSRIQKKEDEVTKLLGDIIRLKNELSIAIDRELTEGS